MKRVRAECPCEAEVAGAVFGGRWPDRSTEALQMHARSCVACSDVVAVGTALRDEHEAVMQRAHVPAAGQVWWRATIRARMDAAQTAARPITWLQGVAGACLVGLGCAVAAVAWPSVTDAAGRAALLVAGTDSGVLDAATSMLATVKSSLPLMLVAAGATVLAPLLVLYFALVDRE